MAAAVPPTTGSPATTSAPAPQGPLPLTPGRITALAIGIPIALALVANTAFSLLTPFAEGRYHVSYTAPASTRFLAVSTDGGQLSVTPTTADRVTLNGTAHYSFIHSTLSEQTTGGNTAVNYHCAPLPSSNCGLDAAVHVPVGLPVALSTDGGDATVTGISAPVTLHSAGGNLSADRITGAVKLDTGGGDIRATDVTSPTVTIHTDGGNIHMTGVRSSQVTASTSGGNIEIDFTSVPRNVHVDTLGGNITLVLPPGTAQYNVNAHTDGGNVSDGLSRNSNSPNKITATSGGGDITLTYQPANQR